MDAFRRTRYAVTLLILIMALFVSAETAFLNNVYAGGVLTLHGGQGNPAGTAAGIYNTATYGHGFTGEDVGFFGSLAPTNTGVTITACTVSSPSSSAIFGGSGVCAITTPSPAAGATVSFNGTFTVGIVAPGDYLIQVVDNNGAGSLAQATLVVDYGPVLQLTPTKGPTGTSVQIKATWLQPSDTSCTISVASGTPGSFIAPSSAGCSTFPVQNATGPTTTSPTTTPGHHGFFTQNATGSFVVGNVVSGQYVVQVTGSSGDFAQAVFNVTSGPFIQLCVSGLSGASSCNIKVQAKGPIGTHVNIEGSNFLESDTSCSLGSPTNGAVIANGACSFFTSGTGFQNVTGSFDIGNVAEGQYVIQVSGNGGDFAQAIINVTAGAFIQLGVNGNHMSKGQVASGPIGTHVDIEGSQWLANDGFNSATCSLGSPTNGAVIANGACSFFKTTSGLVNVTGSFVVGNVPEGQYVIQVSGSAGDSAQAIFNVTAGAFIQLGVNGLFAKVGQAASGPIGTHVSIEGSQFLANDGFNSATCSLGSPTNGAVIQNGACSFFKTTSGFVNVTGSFVVGNVPEGQYVIQVSGSAGDSAQAIFNVTAGAFIQLGVNGIFVKNGQVASGPIGTHVSIEGSNWLANDAFNSATCSIGSPTNGATVLNGACSFFKTTSGLVNVTGSFVVGNVPEGQYVIQVSGSAGDSAQAVFNVTAGAFIQLGVSGVFAKIGRVAKGPTGTAVSIEGSQFLPGDAFNSATCSLSSPTSGTIIQGGACSFFKTTNGLVNVTGSFIVGNVHAGQYVIQVSGSAGDSAQAIFNVTSGPFIQLIVGTIHYSVGQVASGPLGTSVGIEGSYFTATATTCSISSPTSAAIITGAGCSIFIPSSGGFVGFANVTGSFIVGNVLPGQYVIQVTDNTGSFAQAIFNVTLGAQITLIPGTAPPGHDIIVNGTGFLPTDTACVISSPGSSAVLAGSAGCSVRAGTGIVSGSFIVGNVLPGQYVIQVTGNQGDFAQKVLNVTAGPRLSLSPGTGMIGASILVNGTGFLTTDQSCSISSISSPNPILTGSSACVIAVGTGIVKGSFIIGDVSPGEYVIEVTGCVGNSGCAPSVGDFAQAIVAVAPSPSSLSLFPTNATEESTVTFIGTGLSPSDTGCTLLAYNGKGGTLDTNLVTSSTCSITTPGTAQGSFVVSPYATTNVNWNLRVEGTPVGDYAPSPTSSPSYATFNVTADVIVTPTSGTINTVFTFTGSGFSSVATSCTATIVPPFPSSSPGCYMSANTGQVSGSVVVPGKAVPGTYALYVTDNTGKEAAGVFTVGTPSALVVLNPASVDQGYSVGVAGTGFNPNDTYCVISSSAGNPTILFGAVTPTCLISGGYASGSFTVAPNAPGGYYLISVIACAVAPSANVCPAGESLDFGSNFLGVTLATTITTYSTTTTSSSTTTSLSTTTTSIATSFSYSSTTYSTTGILFTTYTQFTLTTVSGQTTTTLTQTTSTTQTQTTVTVSTTTSFTTVPCGPLPCGFAIQPTMNPAPGIDSTGLLAALLLLIPMLLRRLFS